MKAIITVVSTGHWLSRSAPNWSTVCYVHHESRNFLSAHPFHWSTFNRKGCQML